MIFPRLFKWIDRYKCQLTNGQSMGVHSNILSNIMPMATKSARDIKA